MRVLKLSLFALLLTVALSAPSFAQTPPAGAPKPQTPAQTPTAPPPAAQPAPKAAPVPFPQDSKFAFIDVNAIAANSTAGKEATKRLSTLQEKKMAELQDKNKQLQAAQAKLNSGGAVLNDAARSQLEKDIDRMQRDIQFTQQNAQAEMNELQNELQADFQKKLIPIIQDLAKEKGLYGVFSIADSGAIYYHPGLDVSDEVVKRLDAKK